jgi:hypothetical protein
MSTSVPPELATSIARSSQQYGVPQDILTGVWRIESGSTFPNPAVNSSGYGGLFGTKEWNAPTQQQSDLAASTLAYWQQRTGSWDTALHYYSSGKPTGGYGISKVNIVNGNPPQTQTGGNNKVLQALGIQPLSNPIAGDIPGAINNFTSTVSKIPDTIVSDLKPIGIGVGIGLLAILLIVVGVFAIVGGPPKVVPIPV